MTCMLFAKWVSKGRSGCVSFWLLSLLIHEFRNGTLVFPLPSSRQSTWLSSGIYVSFMETFLPLVSLKQQQDLIESIPPSESTFPFLYSYWVPDFWISDLVKHVLLSSDICLGEVSWKNNIECRLRIKYLDPQHKILEAKKKKKTIKLWCCDAIWNEKFKTIFLTITLLSMKDSWNIRIN